MKSWMIDIAKEIILEKQEAHVTAWKLYNLQNKLDESYRNDKSHIKSLSENV